MTPPSDRVDDSVLRWIKNRPNSTAFWLTVAAIVLVGGVLLPATGWDWLRSGTSESQGESNSTTIRNIGFLVAGALALVFAVWRGVLAQRQAATAERQAETALRQTETAQRQVEIAQQGLLNERYQKGADMLGSEVLTVRLGGIYALQRLAKEHPEQYHVQVMRLLCAFVRLPSKDQSIEPGPAAIEPGTLLGIRHDVDAIMQAIGSRSNQQIALEREADFRLDLRGAELTGAQLLDADLSHARFHHARLSNVNFANTDLTDAFLSHADLSQAQFVNVNFTRARFWSAILSGAMLQDADLPRMDFHYANLERANLIRANLSGAIFQDVNAANARFDRACLPDAGFLRTDLSGAHFTRADLSGARFGDVDLYRTNLAKANLSGAEFSVGDRQGANRLTQVQLDQARADAGNPPKLDGILDAETGEPLVWRGKPIDADP